MSSSIRTMTASDFVTAFALRPGLLAWFLGAGASAASGIKTGYGMIRQFKADIFCNEMNLSSREIDSSDPIWVERIDAFLRVSGLLPPDGHPTEYAVAFEKVYPEVRHRRQYIADQVSRGTPCFGHIVLGGLVAARLTPCVFTTNFDSLVEQGARNAIQVLPTEQKFEPTVAAIDSADRALRCLKESDWPLVAKLHGDYQSEAIKNTGSELELQDPRMEHVLTECGKRFGMVFVGYSGRDESVIKALTAVLQDKSPFPNGLYWVTPSASRLLPAVVEFITNAQRAGVDAYVVECKTFDELAGEVMRQVKLPAALQEFVMSGRPEPRLVPVVVPTEAAQKFPVLRYSALLVESLPQKARRITLAKPAHVTDVRELLKAGVPGPDGERRRCRALVAMNGRELAAFGDDQELLAALAPLGPKLEGTVALEPTQNSWALGLVYDALVTALARGRPLRPRLRYSGHALTVAGARAEEDRDRALRRKIELAGLRQAYGGDLTGLVAGLNLPFQEGIRVKLEHIVGRWWCSFEPHTFVDLPPRPKEALTLPEVALSEADGVGAPSGRWRGDPAGDWRRERWATRYNGHWARMIDAWCSLLTSSHDCAPTALGLQDSAGIDASFQLSRLSGFSRPRHAHAYFQRTS